MYSAAKFQQSNTYQYPTEKKVGNFLKYLRNFHKMQNNDMAAMQIFCFAFGLMAINNDPLRFGM